MTRRGTGSDRPDIASGSDCSPARVDVKFDRVDGLLLLPDDAPRIAHYPSGIDTSTEGRESYRAIPDRRLRLPEQNATTNGVTT